MPRAPSDPNEDAPMPAEFPETAPVNHSGFGKTVPAELPKPPGARLLGLLSPQPQRSPPDLRKVHWREVVFAVVVVLALVGSWLSLSGV
jgi:hypothetical protein